VCPPPGPPPEDEVEADDALGLGAAAVGDDGGLGLRPQEPPALGQEPVLARHRLPLAQHCGGGGPPTPRVTPGGGGPGGYPPGIVGVPRDSQRGCWGVWGCPGGMVGCPGVPRGDVGVPRGAQGGCWGVPGCSRKDNVVPRWILGCSRGMLGCPGVLQKG